MEGEEEGLLGEEAPASLDLLHKKINELENENERLKIEVSSPLWLDSCIVRTSRDLRISAETRNGFTDLLHHLFQSQSWTEDLAVEEEKETELINECVRELNEKNKAAAKLQEELARKTESVLKQQEEITQLLGQQVDLQKKVDIISRSDSAEDLLQFREMTYETSRFATGCILIPSKGQRIIIHYSSSCEITRSRTKRSVSTWRL